MHKCVYALLYSCNCKLQYASDKSRVSSACGDKNSLNDTIGVKSPHLEIAFMLLKKRLEERGRRRCVEQSLYPHPVVQIVKHQDSLNHILLPRFATIIQSGFKVAILTFFLFSNMTKCRWITLVWYCRIQTAGLQQPTPGPVTWQKWLTCHLVLRKCEIIENWWVITECLKIYK